MLTRPDVPQLLARIAATLEKTVQPDPATAFARQQVKAAVFALRDLEVRTRIAGDVLRADIHDMRGVLAAHGSDLASGDGPGTDTGLAATHLRLQAALDALEGELLAALDVGATAGAARAGLRDLRAVHRRALEREAAARAALQGDAAAGE